MPEYNNDQIQNTIHAIYESATPGSVSTNMVASVLDNLFQRVDASETNIDTLSAKKADKSSLNNITARVSNLESLAGPSLRAYAHFSDIIGSFKVASGYNGIYIPHVSGPNLAPSLGQTGQEMLSHAVHDDFPPLLTAYNIVFLSSSKCFVAATDRSSITGYYQHWQGEEQYNVLSASPGDIRGRQDCLFISNGSIFTFDGDNLIKQTLSRAEIVDLIRAEIAAAQTQNNE